MVNNNIRNNYYSSFLKESLKFLKDGFGVLMTFYGYSEGTVVKIEMKRGIAHHLEQKQESDDLSGALLKTTLLTKAEAETLKGKTVDTTLVSVVTINCYILIKSDKESEWTNEAAVKDFNRIITKVKTKYGK